LYVTGVVLLYHIDASIFESGATGWRFSVNIGLEVVAFWPVVGMLTRLRFFVRPSRELPYRACKRLLEWKHKPNEPPFTPIDARSHATQHFVLGFMFMVMTLAMRIYRADEQTVGDKIVAKLTPALFLIGNGAIHSAWFG